MNGRRLGFLTSLGPPLFKIALVGLFFLSSSARGQSKFNELLTRDEFQELAVEFSKKVNLFEAIWQIDPHAEFFGGTTRDYLYWLRGEFQNLESRAQIDAKIQKIRDLPLIDAREFIIGDSDVDVATKSSGFDSFAQIFGVKRIDTISPARFVPGSAEETSEKNQGSIPVEKIRLGFSGFTPWDGFGDGIKEIYEGRPTVSFTPKAVFLDTIYAQQRRNHQLFLALRFVRTLAINYYRLHGRHWPDSTLLFDIDQTSREQTMAAIQDALVDPLLTDLLDDQKFCEKTNALIQKIFRSFTNVTAASQLYNYFLLQELHAKFPKKLEPTNQYLFAKPPIDSETLVQRFKEYGTTPNAIFQDPQKILPGLVIMHGVSRGPKAHRDIVIQGALPSDSTKNAGSGLYAVAEPDKQHAITWCGSPRCVVQIPVAPSTRLVDISTGPGKELFVEFSRRTKSVDYDAFADYFGVQILKYEHSFPAVVVKDSTILGRARALTQDVLTFEDISKSMAKVTSQKEALAIFASADKWEITSFELAVLRKNFVIPWFVEHPLELQSLDELIDFLKSPLASNFQASERKFFQPSITAYFKKFVTPKASIQQLKDMVKAIRLFEHNAKSEREFVLNTVLFVVAEKAKNLPSHELEEFLYYLGHLKTTYNLPAEIRAIFPLLPQLKGNPRADFLRAGFEDFCQSYSHEGKYIFHLKIHSFLQARPGAWKNFFAREPGRRLMLTLGLDDLPMEHIVKLATQVRHDRKLSQAILKILESHVHPWKHSLIKGTEERLCFVFLPVVAAAILAIPSDRYLLKLFITGLLNLPALHGWLEIREGRKSEMHPDALKAWKFSELTGTLCSRRIRDMAKIEMQRQ